MTGSPAIFTWYLASANVYEVGTPSGIFSGNVGIGIANPAYKLDVSGSSHISGNLTVDGAINGVLTASMNAANVSAGTFGANTGNGNYSFNGSV